jgi:Ice-binding-like
VQLVNGAQACNVFWQVGSSATLNSASTFVGTIMALTSATLLTGATVQGRVLAQNGDVTLDANTITAPTTCLTTSPTTTTTTTSPTSTTATTSPAGSGGTGGTGGTTITTGTSGGSGGAAAGTTTGASTGAGTGVVPTGFPHTGLGGAAHARYGDLIALGALALVGSIGLFAIAVRRRLIGPQTVGASRHA